MKGTEQPASLGSRAGSRWGVSEAEGARSTCEGLGEGGGSRLRKKRENKVERLCLSLAFGTHSWVGFSLTSPPSEPQKEQGEEVVRIQVSIKN